MNTHPDKHLFRPHSSSAILRQSIYAILTKAPDQDFLLTDLAKMTESKPQNVRSACKMLARKGLVERTSRTVSDPTKKNLQRTVQRIAVKLIPPWGKKLEGKW